MSTVRRCALPGCDVVIELEDGGQPRRYCCPEHRRASRFSRRVQEAAKSTEPPDDRDVSLADGPSLFEATAVELPARARLRSSRPPLDVALPPINREQRRRTASRRQRAVAVLATTAVFAGAGWAASTQSSTVPSPTPGAGAAMPTPDQLVPKRTAVQWATEAQQTLDSVNHQLDLIAQAEEMWNRQPAALRSGPTPPAVQEMRSRGTVLGQQQALLQLQLETYKSLDPANREVGDAERKVAAAQSKIPTDPQAANTPEARRLAEQRDVFARSLDAERQKQATVNAAVEKSVASPLPDSSNVKPITDSVLGLVTDPLRRKPPTEPENKPPAAVPPRDTPSRPRQDDVGKVAPPRPGPPSLGTGDAATPSVPTPADSAAAAPSRPSTPPSPNSQPAMTMLDSPGAAEPQPPSSDSTPTTSRAAPDSGNNYNGNWSPSPRPRQNSSSSDLSQLSSSSDSSRGWSASEIRALLRDEPSGGDSRGGGSRDGGKHDGGKHDRGGKHSRR